MIEQIKARLNNLGNAEQAKFLQRFFKTAPGQYAAGDIFIGVRVPVLRAVVKEFPSINCPQAIELLQSQIHEERLLALLFLVRLFNKDKTTRAEIYQHYLENTQHINNWDLVDASAPPIVGRYLHGQSSAPLYQLARSSNLWERRIAIIATFWFIRKGQFADTLAIAELLLNDREDLIHKAVGWMLREVGKHDLTAEQQFLDRHYRAMPRTMLRYAIEKFPEEQRQDYLKGRVS